MRWRQKKYASGTRLRERRERDNAHTQLRHNKSNIPGIPMTVDTRSSRCSTGTACSSSFACRECEENVKRTDCLRRNRVEHARHCIPELRRADRILQGNRCVRAVRTTHCWNRRPFPLALRTLKKNGRNRCKVTNNRICCTHKGDLYTSHSATTALKMKTRRHTHARTPHRNPPRCCQSHSVWIICQHQFNFGDASRQIHFDTL